MLRSLRSRLVALNVTSGRAAAFATAVALVLIASFFAIPRGWSGYTTHFSGTADSANTLVVARNLMERGRFEVDYLGHYFYAWPSVTHAEDSFPLFHPLLVAALSLAFHDVWAGANIHAGLVVFGLFAGIPLLVLRARGALAATTSFAVLAAFEGHRSVLIQHSNDGGAVVLVGLGWALLVHDLREPGARLRSRFVAACLLITLGVLHKTSSGVIAIVALAALALEVGRPRRDRVVRMGALVASLGLAHLPELVWSYIHLGEIGVPRNSPGRAFVRTIAHRSNFQIVWEGYRRYWPAHPEGPKPPSENGFVTAVGRVWRGIAKGGPSLLPLPWIASLLSAARTRVAARSALGAFVVCLLLPLYSHYEERYFFVLRPLIAIALGGIVSDAATELEMGGIGRALMAASFLGSPFITHADFWKLTNVIVPIAALAIGICVFLVWRSSKKALAAAVLAATALAAVVGAGTAVDSVLDLVLSPREPFLLDAEVLESATAPDEIVMSRRPWNLNLHTRRRGIMIPLDPEDVCTAAARYGATAVLVDDVDAYRLRRALPMISALDVRLRMGEVTLYDLPCGRGPSDARSR